MSYDLIIITQSNTTELAKLTENCIASARLDDVPLNVIVVETGHPYRYKCDHTITYKGDFNYNKALNMGLKHAKSEFQILANNDIIFHKGWSKIGDIMRANKYLSASALSNDERQKHFKKGFHAYEGYNIGFQLTGWCIFTDHKLWDQINRLDETYQFWFSDNVYADQLKEKGIKHALICSIRVDHLGSRTLQKQPRRIQQLYTGHQGKLVRYAKNRRT